MSTSTQSWKYDEVQRYPQRFKRSLVFYAVLVVVGFFMINGTKYSIPVTPRADVSELFFDRPLKDQSEDLHPAIKRKLKYISSQGSITPSQLGQLLTQKNGISLEEAIPPTDSSIEIGKSSDQMDSKQPVYAWYVKRANNIIELEEELIRKWKENWSNYGYDPQVLGIEDARKLPEYEYFEEKIEDLFSTESAKGKRNFKLKECYYRYLAMAATGGGMMVDLDTTPVSMVQSKEPPEQFTLYCQVNSPSNAQNHLLQDLERQSGTPCAASGIADEWLRIAKLAIWVTDNVKRDDIWWTDMHSVLLLRSVDEIALLQSQVADSPEVRGWDSCAFRFM